ncbi:rhodanese-like domain-containing protein [Calothrix rhizosoleniae]|uniref:rhodanese-like domain-containing protein n=1 Tax=Calothrix rhizosoleniae TaxID=888997 RepID=UPI000B49E92B|nr:rhodanese-like domain-containing protein [Calothrix rhizosoleniae]
MASVDVNDIISRLQWGQPALTIIDVRDRSTYNQGHIMGALPISIEELTSRAKASLNTQREIYLYGESDEQTADAVKKLQVAGFTNVSEITGGLAAWKNAGGAIEGAVS